MSAAAELLADAMLLLAEHKEMAGAGELLAGKTFLAGGESELQTGRMPEKCAWSSSVAMNGSVVVPAGHHNGGGKVNGPSITDHWVQDGKYAVQVWEVHDIPVSDDTDTIS